MSLVYLCLDLEEDRPMALKTFRPEFLPDRDARDRFLSEGSHWVELGAHPHVVRCYNVLYIDPGVYLVLELVAKEQGREDASLRSWLTPGMPMPAETALLFALQAARGMAHAVGRIPGFVHRDLKPENVLLGADRLFSAPANRLRITDFGLARALQTVDQSGGEQRTTSADRYAIRLGPFAGTPEYAAPEQFVAGTPLDLQADVYALGCILVEMLTGQMPVRATSDKERLSQCEHQHRRGQALTAALSSPLSQQRGFGGSDPLHPLFERFLAIDPAVRYASWSEVEAALSAAYRVVTGQPAPASEQAAALGRAERVAAGWSYSAMGYSYLDLGRADTALGYFERARAVGAAEEE
jgi:serine/threonine protein kinase